MCGGTRGGYAPAPRRYSLEEDPEALPQLSQELVTLKELFSDWNDEDLLAALDEANNDLQIAITRITDGQSGPHTPSHSLALLLTPLERPPGHAQQWGLAKPKKSTKKEVAPPAQPSPFVGRGRFVTRAAPRGGPARGAPRGARGGLFPQQARSPYSNGDSNGTTPSSFLPDSAQLVVPTWGAAAKSTVAPGWGDVAPETATPSSEWGAATETSTTATVGWGEETPADSNGSAEERPLTPQVDGWSSAPAAPKARQPSKIIAPGAKMSWAQATRSVSVAYRRVNANSRNYRRPITPPKPTPPPPAPVAPKPAVAAAPAPEPVAVPEPVEQQIVLPEPGTLPVVSTWGDEPAAPGPLDAWGSSTPVPLGVGAGWADSVVAAQDLSYQHPQVTAEIEAHLPPNDIHTAGPIALSTPTVEEVAPAPVAAPAQQIDENDKFGPGPPGLAKRASTTAARSQEQAVVMPNERATEVERVGVQFGSLNMFGSQPTFGQQEAAPQEVPVAQEQQSFVFRPSHLSIAN